MTVSPSLVSFTPIQMLKYQGTCFVTAMLMPFYFLHSVIHCSQGQYIIVHLGDKSYWRKTFNRFPFLILFIFFSSNWETEKASLNYFELLKNRAILFPQGVLYISTRPLNLGLHSKICAVETSIAPRRVTYMTKYSRLSLSYC